MKIALDMKIDIRRNALCLLLLTPHPCFYANRLQAPSRVIQQHDGETVLYSASVEDDLLIKIKAD